MDIKQQWQRQWREILDEPTDTMPAISEDYVLHFDIWELEEEKLRECFSLFPNGDLLLKRVNEVKRCPPKTTKIDDQALLHTLERLNDNIETVLHQFGDPLLIALNGEKSTAERRSVYRGNEDLRLDVLSNTDSPTIHLDDDLSEIMKQCCGDEGYEAFLFLREPLYQLSDCDYTASHWIAWAMVQHAFSVDPYQPAFDLYKMNAQAGWRNEELFVFIESE